MIRLCWFIFVIKLGQPSFWGEIPVEIESVQLRLDEKSVSRLDVHLHSQTLGRITLHLSTLSDLVADYAKTHTVDRHTHEQTPITNGCHYRGYVNEKEPSSAIFSDCSGRLRGTFTIDSDTWYILYHGGSYILFPESVLPNPPEVASAEYGGKEIKPGDSRSVFKRDIGSRKRSKREPTVPTKTLEVVVVTDKSMWDHFTQENLNLEEFVTSTIAYIDEIYRKYGIRVALVGYERWRVENLITVSPSYSQTLRNFTMYRQKKLLDVYKQHDVSILMTNVDFDGPVIGYAGVDTMCRSSASNVNFNSRSDAMFFGSVIAHEIGHNFGMYHDGDDCVCPPDDACVMSSVMGYAVTTFSNCSRLVLDHFTGTCLHNQPKSLYGDPVCGNGFVEEGEECDCGTEEECLASDPCCEPVGCKLKLGAECYSGDCCEKCRFVSYKQVCRPASSECDLVEFCTGTNSQCPTNRYNQDGSMCGSSTGFCNYGSCQTRDSQCISLWGQSASSAAGECYQRYNSKGEWYGNCGSLDNNKYLACTENNIMCGKLYCSVPEGVKPSQNNVYGSRFNYNDTVSCSMASAPRKLAEDSQDIAMVYDGTKCGTQKWCLAGQCVEFEKVTCPSPGGVVCGGHGTCNDLNQCHCDAGYDPEFNCTVLLTVAGWNIKKIMMVVMIMVLVVLPLCIAALLIARRYNPRVKSFLDHHSKIRFSVRMPSLSRTSSYIRRARGRSTGSAGSTKAPRKNPPPRPTKQPLKDQISQPRPPGCYRTSTGWATSSFHHSPDDVTVTSSPDKKVPPPRPPSTYNNTSNPLANNTYYSPEKRPEPAAGPSSNTYTPLSLHPARAAPGPPPARPSSEAYDNITTKSGPKAFQSSSRDNVKLAISGPEGARKLLNDQPLDDRTLAGSPLRDIRR